MHIMVLPSWFENLQHPTSGSFFKDQAIGLASNGHKVGLIFPIQVSLKAPYYWRPKQQGKESNISILKNSYFTLPKLRQYNINKRIRAFEKLYKSYIRINGKPDVLHAHSCALGPSGSAGLAARYISKKYNIPYVITEHGSAFHTSYYKTEDKPAILDAFEHAQSLVAVSESLYNDLKQFGVCSPIKILGNIVDTELFGSAVEKYTPAPQYYTFIVIAYLRPIKQIDKIIQAFSIVHKSNSSVRLKIVGNGEQKKSLQILTDNLNLNEVVEFTGELSRESVAKQMALSNCYILMSEYETFAVVVHEALAAGKAVISTRCGGPEKTLSDLNEKILEDGAIPTLAEAMLQKTKENDAETRIIERQQYIENHFSQKIVSQTLEAELRLAINQSKGQVNNLNA